MKTMNSMITICFFMAALFMSHVSIGQSITAQVSEVSLFEGEEREIEVEVSLDGFPLYSWVDPSSDESTVAVAWYSGDPYTSGEGDVSILNTGNRIKRKVNLRAILRGVASITIAVLIVGPDGLHELVETAVSVYVFLESIGLREIPLIEQEPLSVDLLAIKES